MALGGHAHLLKVRVGRVVAKIETYVVLFEALGVLILPETFQALA
jgi:hypothetical protein